MTRVLHVLAALNDGGVERLLYNYYKHIDNENIKFDFVIFEPEKGMLEDEFLKYGSKIYHIPPKKQGLFKSNKELKKIIKLGKYDVIHCHQNFSNIFSLMYAKKYKIPIRICHSHDANVLNYKTKLLKSICNVIFTHCANVFLGCSTYACKWLYNKKNQSKAIVINNAIEVEKFEYNSNIRKEIREVYKINDKFVVGCVARLNIQKNHKYLFDIFKEIINKESNAVLFLVGSGNLYEQLQEYAAKLNILDKIIFAGNRENVNDLLQAFDVFVLPSNHEGLGIVFIESQVSGLLTYASKDIVPIETNISDCIHYISLKDTPNYWANQILSDYKKYGYNRTSHANEAKEYGFDVETEALKLEKIYVGDENL